MSKKVIVINSSGEVVPPSSALISSSISQSEESFIPSNYGAGFLPIIVDSAREDIYASTFTTIGATNSIELQNDFETPKSRSLTLQTRSKIVPIADQQISGTLYKGFATNELVYQSNIRPEVINFYAPSGITATEYNPIIGITGVSGFLGNNAAQFMGSYLDLDTPTAGLSLPGFSSAGTTGTCFLISGFILLESNPSTTYDPVIAFRGVCGSAGIGIGTTSDSFSLEYDSDISAKRLKFYFSHSSHSNSGFSYSMNVSPASGVTLGQWHHFAVSWINAGSSASICSYWNGERQEKIATIAGNIRNTPSSFYVGCGPQGYRPLKGWLDDIMVSIGSTNGGRLDPVRGFTGGATGPTITTHQEAGFYTVYYLGMDGPEGTSLFPCDTTNKIMSNVAFYNGDLFIYGNIGSTASRTWTTPIVGVCGGHAVPGTEYGYIFGYDTKSCFIPTAVTDLTSGLTGAKEYRKDLIDYSFRYYLGITAMAGASGASGDFTNLYSGSTFPTSWTYYGIESNLNYLKNVYDAIIVGGSTAEVGIPNAEGNYYSFVTAAACNLYKDVLAYFGEANTARTFANNAIDSKTSYTDLKLFQGITQSKIVSKLAASGNSLVYIPVTSLTTKTNRSPENYWNIGVEQEKVEAIP